MGDVSGGVAAPSSYIEKVNLATGELIPEEIEPEMLLVQKHRDYHVVDIYARFMMGQLIEVTGNEELVRQAMKEVRKIGHAAASWLSSALGVKDPSVVAEKLFGLKDREYYFRFKKESLPPEEIAGRVAQLKEEAASALKAVSVEGRPRTRVLLTGGTGFVGKEIIWQAVRNPLVAELVVVIRPKSIRDRETGELIETLSPEQRGQALLGQLWIEDEAERAKVRFIAGDIEQPRLGISDEDFEELKASLTHVIHCAASVAFDDPYEDSFRANVNGSINALRFSRELQEAGGPFVAHLAIETSYIHGRQARNLAREDEVVFPRNFYNNYYELTKAIASIETERFMLEEGLRIVQLCPAIVIGESRAGNNRGDLKVVNAPVNAFGRAEQALSTTEGGLLERSKGRVIAQMASVFPGDATAEINLVPVDRVAAGIIAALSSSEAVGERIHLATDNRITTEQIRDIVLEELGVKVTLSEPTFHRNVRLPLLTKLLRGLHQEKLAHALEKLGAIFGGYSEWGQPVHEVGNDVKVLGLPAQRPRTDRAFRMLCRHNKFIQDFGKIRDLDEISRRERIWLGFIEDLERLSGRPAGALSAEDFRRGLELGLVTTSLERAGEARGSA